MQKTNNNTVKNWADEERPREKMIANGPESLTDAELLAILIETGIPGENVVNLAKRILNESENNLYNLFQLSIKDLKTRYKGIGTAKATKIEACFQLGLRLVHDEKKPKDNIVRNSEDIFNFIASKFIAKNHEEFHAIYLNNRNKVLKTEMISKGGISETSVDIRLVFKSAIECDATAIAVVHNHPSGRLEPSNKDKSLTQNLVEAGKLLRIQVIEHIIIAITREGIHDYFSFFDNGLM